MGLEEEAPVPANVTDLVTVENGKATTTSLKVAEVFGKRHKHVLDTIDQLVEKGVPNFRPTPYVHPQNGQEYRMYLMDRDGFSLLVMGFTGDKALDWKLKYIEAFNKMEKALLDQRNNPALPQSYSEALRALADEAEARQALEAENKVLSPKATYADDTTSGGTTMNITNLARGLKEYGFPGGLLKLSNYLLAKGILLEKRGVNRAYARGYKVYRVPKDEYITRGYFNWYISVNGGIVPNTYTITPKGQRFICEMLMADGLIDAIPAWAMLHEEVV